MKAIGLLISWATPAAQLPDGGELVGLQQLAVGLVEIAQRLLGLVLGFDELGFVAALFGDVGDDGEAAGEAAVRLAQALRTDAAHELRAILAAEGDLVGGVLAQSAQGELLAKGAAMAAVHEPSDGLPEHLLGGVSQHLADCAG